MIVIVNLEEDNGSSAIYLTHMHITFNWLLGANIEFYCRWCVERWPVSGDAQCRVEVPVRYPVQCPDVGLWSFGPSDLNWPPSQCCLSANSSDVYHFTYCRYWNANNYQIELQVVVFFFIFAFLSQTCAVQEYFL